MTGLPAPEPGLIISYAYLWHHEAEKGMREGRKDRPSAIVLAQEMPGSDGHQKVVVAPITHTPPQDPNVAVEIPAALKKHLGLDGNQSWVILDEFNVFTWPGYDIRPISRDNPRIDYGFLPPKFFKTLIAKISELREKQKIETTNRDDDA
jgi:hypothetical protein